MNSEKLESFYGKTVQLSYSGMKKLLWSPKAYYRHYIEQEKTEDKIEKSLLLGRVTHCLLLEPDKLWDKFLEAPSKLPSAAPLKVIRKVYKEIVEEGLRPSANMKKYKERFVEVLEEESLYQKFTPEVRDNKFFSSENISYWIYLTKASENLDVIDSEVVEKATERSEAVKNASKAMHYLGQNILEEIGDNREVFNELYLDTPEDEGLGFALRGIVDNITIDHDRKVILVNDFKTTSKSVADFGDSIEFYKYSVQAAVYKKLVEANYSKYSDYEIEFRFVVADDQLQVAIFNVTPETMTKWSKELEENLKVCSYHIKNRKFDLPYKFKDSIEIDI